MRVTPRLPLVLANRITTLFLSNLRRLQITMYFSSLLLFLVQEEEHLSHEWDAREWYNKNPSAGGGNISPEQLPPLKVVKNLEHPSLTVRLQNPYGQIKPSKIAVCKANENFCEKECAIDKDNAHCKYTINGMANFTDLSPNDTYTVIVPKTIDIVPHKIRAIFSASSNGEKHVSNNDIEEIKNVNLRSNVELLTLYNTQYNLAVDVDLQDPIIGDGSESNSMLDSIFGAHPIPRHEDQKNLV